MHREETVPICCSLEHAKDSINLMTFACQHLQVQRHLDVPVTKPKVIVFSQFWIHINLVRTHLMNRGINFATLKADLPAAEKIEALERFQVLVLSAPCALSWRINSCI